MVLIRTNSKDEVIFKHFKPELLEESQKNGYLVDEIPVFEDKESTVTVLKYTESNGFSVEYQAIVDDNIETRISDLELLVAEIGLSQGGGL